MLGTFVVKDGLVDEFAQEVLRSGAVKTVDFHAVTVCDDGGKAAYLVAPGDAHVFVGIDIGQHEAALVVLRQSVQ